MTNPDRWLCSVLRMLVGFVALVALAACASGDEPSPTTEAAAPGNEGATAPAAPQITPTPDTEPQAFVPAGPIGDADAYEALIDRLELTLDADLRSTAPWPDLRNPDPVLAQEQMFAFWIWMEANAPEPELIDVLAAPDSPTRSHVATLFGELDNNNEVRVRPDAPYRAFNQRTVTFESAGLPLWLRRDVPEPAVVIYYDDESGATELRDRDTQELLNRMPGTARRSWVAIMVETEVGWLMWSDTPLDGSNDLEVPDLERPDPNAERNRTDL